MSPEQMTATAIAFGFGFIVTLGFGKWLLSRRKPKAEPAALDDAMCSTREEERHAWTVLDAAKALIPDLDLEKMQREVHP